MHYNIKVISRNNGKTYQWMETCDEGFLKEFVKYILDSTWQEYLKDFWIIDIDTKVEKPLLLYAREHNIRRYE